MFRKPLILSLAFLAACAALLIVILSHVDETGYQELNAPQSLAQVDGQLREGVTKDIWMDDRHIHLESAISTISLNPFVERMHNVTGSMDDYILVADALEFDGKEIRLLGHSAITSPTLSLVTNGEITIDPKGDKIYLTGDIRLNDSMTAKKVVINRKDHSIEGIGNVHVTLNKEEIDDLIRRKSD